MEAGFMGYPFKTMWRGIVTHLLAVLFLVGGVFLGIAGVMNLFTFATYVYLTLMVVLLFTSSDGLKPNVPPSASLFFYGALTILLVFFGHFGLGAAWLVSGLILGHLTDEYIKKMKELEEKNKAKGARVTSMKGAGSNQAMDEQEEKDLVIEDEAAEQVGVETQPSLPSTIPSIAP